MVAHLSGTVSSIPMHPVPEDRKLNGFLDGLDNTNALVKNYFWYHVQKNLLFNLIPFPSSSEERKGWNLHQPSAASYLMLKLIVSWRMRTFAFVSDWWRRSFSCEICSTVLRCSPNLGAISAVKRCQSVYWAKSLILWCIHLSDLLIAVAGGLFRVQRWIGGRITVRSFQRDVREFTLPE